MIRDAVKKRLSMGSEGRFQHGIACMACGHYLNAEPADDIKRIPCPKCGKICYQNHKGETFLGKNEDFEQTQDYVHFKVRSMFLELQELAKEMGSVEELTANIEKTAVISERIKTWLWEHHDPIIYYNFFDILRQGGAKEFADTMETAADFDHKSLEEEAET